MRITVLDKDTRRAESICATLRAAGHRCRRADHADDVLAEAAHAGLDLVVLDWSAHADDLRLLQALRAGTRPVALLLMAKRGAEKEILSAMEAGASDYIVKPVRLGELATRVQVLLKRAFPDDPGGESLCFGRYAFEASAGRLTVDGNAVALTQKEFELALLLFRHLGRPLSRAFLREVIWPAETDLPSRTLDTHVSRVRTKLELRPENGFRLSPVYSYGYLLEQLAE